MKLSKKIVGLIIGLIVISLAGLIVLQISLLNSAKKLKEQTFQRNVSNALNAISEMLETHEVAIAAINVVGDTAACYNIDVIAGLIDEKTKDSLKPKIMIISGDTSRMSVESLSISDSNILKSFSWTDTGSIDFGQSNVDSARYVIGLKMASDTGRIVFVEKVLSRLWGAGCEPVENRLDSVLLDSIIRIGLTEANINLDYAYAVTDGSGDSLRFITPEQYADELQKSEFKKRLYPYDLLSPQIDLMLFFPDRETYLRGQISPILISTIVFMLIIVFCFAYTIKTILVQRRNASLMVDFVNNMTHEFKTPISTVALACEAIMRPDTITNNGKVIQFSKMIRDENLRMRQQAEKILQMAALEEGDFELKLSDVDMHKIISDAIENIALQIENCGGRISFTPDAENYILPGDKVHLSNIIFNLLDNAIKYSSEKPIMSISTRNERDGIVIRIEDKGMGIRNEDLKMVFKKYYRVSSGNIHDVKGFGLGLSYVKLMVEAHGGTISLNSTFGEGTQVEIYFPFSGKAS